MKEILKNIFKGIWLGLMMTGLVLSIIEGRLLFASRENYWLLLFFVSVLIICLAWVVYLFKEGMDNVTLAIGILSAVGVVIAEILVGLDVVLSF